MAGKKKTWLVVGIIGGAVVLLCGGGIVALAAFGFLGARTAAGYSDAQLQTARVDLRNVREAVELYRLDDPEGCPSAMDLVSMGMVQDVGLVTDPWGHLYQIECPADGPRVASLGPDGAPGTADDVTVP